MGGAVVFTGHLLTQLRFPLDFDYIHVTRYGRGTKGGEISWHVGPKETIAGRIVLVLDDILDEGETLAAVRSAHTGGRRGSVLQRGSRGQGDRPPEADHGGLRGGPRAGPLCVWIRHGRPRPLAQPSRDLRPQIDLISDSRKHSMLAIIGGSGFAHLANLKWPSAVIRTPYGEPSGALTFGTPQRPRRRVSRAPRLRPHHPAAQVNYRANIWALHSSRRSGVNRNRVGWRDSARSRTRRVGASGSDHRLHSQPQEHLLRGAGTTGDAYRLHAPLLRPGCRQMPPGRQLARSAAEAGGVYGATQGPRLETAAEIDRLERDGVHMVGMTGMPEAALAREIGLEYASIAVVANCAAGRGASRDGIRLQELQITLQAAVGRVKRDTRSTGGSPWRLDRC